jgi:hypothetical protein
MSDTKQEQIEAARLKADGLTRAQIAERMGLSARQVKSRLAAAARDPAIQGAMDAIGSGMEPSTVWVKTDGYSVMLRPERKAGVTLEDIADAFDNITPAAPVVPPASVMDDLLTIYPLFDVHFGMLSWGDETGEDYDTKLASSDMAMALVKTMALTPDSHTALLLIGGDFFHADDGNAETPASKHKLDVDGRHNRVVDLGVDLLANAVDALLQKHAEVRIKVLRGNHDEHSHIVLRVAMSQRYRNEPRVMVDDGKADLFHMAWGVGLIAAHHGDRSKPERLALEIADTCPDWSTTRQRYVFTGHVHHTQVKDLGAIQWESLRAFCPRDAYAAGHHYSSRRQMQSITFHREDGLVLRAYDPVRR